MHVVEFLNCLGLGGTEKASLRWSQGLVARGHRITILSLEEGPRRSAFEAAGFEVRTTGHDTLAIRRHLEELKPDAIHAHAPGFPHQGNRLGQALEGMKRIPVVQTNIFGRLDNPIENQWTDYRLFVSWTSAIQAATALTSEISPDFFKRNSVAVNPLNPEPLPTPNEILSFRQSLGIKPDEIVLGRVARCDVHKWTNLSHIAFLLALKEAPHLKFLLREAPKGLAQSIRNSTDADRFILLPESSDPEVIRQTHAATDITLHATLFGESFGYTLAEPMNLGIPAITNATPWADCAQLELVRNRITGLCASLPQTMAAAILELARDPNLRKTLGTAGREHICQLAEPERSTDRLEEALIAVCAGTENPRQAEDQARANAWKAQFHLSRFGETLEEKNVLQPLHAKIQNRQNLENLQGVPSWLFLAH